MATATPTSPVYPDASSLGRPVWASAYRAARCAARDASDHGPEHAALLAGWLMAGMTEATYPACRDLAFDAAHAKPTRPRSTVGRLLREAVLAHHGLVKARWIVTVMTKGHVRPAAKRLPDAPDPWRAGYAPAALALPAAA